MPHTVTLWHRNQQSQNIIASTLNRSQLVVRTLNSLSFAFAHQSLYILLGTTRYADLELVNTVEKLIHQRPHTRVIVLCARGNDAEYLQYYRAGAHLCLPNQSSLQVLSTYLITALRREQGREETPIALGKLTLYPSRRQVQSHQHVVPLRKKEYDILHLLACHRGHAMHRDTIYARTSDAAVLRDSGVVDVHICHIRRKLRVAGISASLINTIPGYGYCIR